VGISRGFRRLSILAGFAGLMLLLFSLDASGDLSGRFSPSAFEWLKLILLFGGIPAAFALLLGWVVAGFRKSN
jgi:hypothetical protein